MKPGMSSRERMLAALTRQGPDHIPFSPYIGQGPWWKEPLFWRDQFERAQRMLGLGLDPVIDIWLPDPTPHSDVTIKTWREASGSGALLTKEYHTPAGVLRQTVRETEDWCHPAHGPWVPTTFGIEKRTHFNMDLFDDHNVSRRTKPWVTGPEDLAKLRYILRPPAGHVLDEWRMDAERAKEFARKHSVLLQARRTIVGDAFQWFCDIPDFVVAMMDQPEFVTEFLSIFEEWAIGLTELALDVGVDVVQHRGWYDIPMYWGINCWKEYLLPFVENQAQRVHEAGKLHVYLLPEGHGALAPLLKEIETDALFGVDPRKLQGGDLKTLFEQLGDSKCFWGGVNAEVTLELGASDDIDKAVAEAVECLGGNGGLILSAMIFQSVPTEKILQLIEAWRKVV